MSNFNYEPLNLKSLIYSAKNLIDSETIYNYNYIKNIILLQSSPQTIGILLVAAARRGIIRDVELYVPIAVGNDLYTEINEALCVAAENVHIMIMDYLLKNGANIHYNNELPLKKAIIAGHIESVDFLLDKGANVHADNDELILLSCRSGDYPDIMNSLILHGIDVLKHYKILVDECYKHNTLQSLTCLFKHNYNKPNEIDNNKYLNESDINEMLMEVYLNGLSENSDDNSDNSTDQEDNLGSPKDSSDSDSNKDNSNN